jgi:hypothetical protein
MTGVAMIGVVGSGGAGGSGGGSGEGSGGGFVVKVESPVYGSNSGAASSGTVTSAAAPATVSGGTAPYTHLWTRVSGDPAISIINSTTDSASFQAVVSNFTTPRTGTFKDTVTDSFGVTVASNELSVSLDWIDTR